MRDCIVLIRQCRCVCTHVPYLACMLVRIVHSYADACVLDLRVYTCSLYDVQGFLLRRNRNQTYAVFFKPFSKHVQTRKDFKHFDIIEDLFRAYFLAMFGGCPIYLVVAPINSSNSYICSMCRAQSEIVPVSYLFSV